MCSSKEKIAKKKDIHVSIAKKLSIAYVIL